MTSFRPPRPAPPRGLSLKGQALSAPGPPHVLPWGGGALCPGRRALPQPGAGRGGGISLEQNATWAHFTAGQTEAGHPARRWQTQPRCLAPGHPQDGLPAPPTRQPAAPRPGTWRACSGSRPPPQPKGWRGGAGSSPRLASARQDPGVPRPAALGRRTATGRLLLSPPGSPCTHDPAPTGSPALDGALSWRAALEPVSQHAGGGSPAPQGSHVGNGKASPAGHAVATPGEGKAGGACHREPRVASGWRGKLQELRVNAASFIKPTQRAGKMTVLKHSNSWENPIYYTSYLSWRGKSRGAWPVPCRSSRRRRVEEAQVLAIHSAKLQIRTGAGAGVRVSRVVGVG